MVCAVEGEKDEGGKEKESESIQVNKCKVRLKVRTEISAYGFTKCFMKITSRTSEVSLSENQLRWALRIQRMMWTLLL